MSNRLLALLILTLIFGGIYGIYYYFFVANVGSLSVITTGASDVSVSITSEFKKSYSASCTKTCLFPDIPPVGYTLIAKKDGYIPVEKTFDIERGQNTRVLIRMDKEIKLKELDELATSTGSDIETTDELDTVNLSGALWSVKDTNKPDVKLITNEQWTFMYSTETKTLTANPLYDDILPLASGDLVTLVRKSSKDKLSLLNLESNGNDYVLLVNIEKKTRKVLLQAKTDGRNLEYSEKKVILIDTNGKRFEIENVE